VLVNAGDLTNASINRSPSAYLANPAEERAMYTHNTESTVTLLKVVSEDQPARWVNQCLVPSA
jgi:neutral ceramidase